MRGTADTTQRLHPGVQVLGVFGIGDQHSWPVLKRHVSETKQVMVESQYPVPEPRENFVSLHFYKSKGTTLCIPHISAVVLVFANSQLYLHHAAFP